MSWCLLSFVALVAAPGAETSSELLPGVKIEAGGQPIDVEIGHAAPFYADWDGDGPKDLLVGQFGGGKLRIYRNIGTNAEPRFDQFTFFQAGGSDASVPFGWCIGFGPQLVDLNGDGRQDVISGSYNPGHLFVFAGQADGSYTEREKIQGADGKSIHVGYASAVYAADWDNDDDLDLVVGNIQGEVYFVPNEGTPGANAFGSPQQLKSNGTVIQVARGDSGPILADWDNDGLIDLLVGAGDGSVTFYRNQGTREAPELASGVQLLPPRPNTATDDSCCGTRTKICATDYDQDGRLDLLVGDFAYVQQPPPELTAEQKAEADKAQQDYNDAMKEYREAVEKTDIASLSRQYQKLLNADGDETAEAAQARESKQEEIMKQMQEIQQQELQPYIDKLMAIQQKLPGRRGTYHGFVWLYQRRPAEAVAATAGGS